MLDELEEAYLPLVTPAYVGMSPTTDSAISWHSARNMHLPISKPSYFRLTHITLIEILNQPERTWPEVTTDTCEQLHSQGS